MDEIAEKISAQILKLAEYEDSETFHNDLQILSLGYIDSFSLLELITFLETEFKIRIESELITVEKFDSVNLIADLIKSLLSDADNHE